MAPVKVKAVKKTAKAAPAKVTTKISSASNELSTEYIRDSDSDEEELREDLGDSHGAVAKFIAKKSKTDGKTIAATATSSEEESDSAGASASEEEEEGEGEEEEEEERRGDGEEMVVEVETESESESEEEQEEEASGASAKKALIAEEPQRKASKSHISLKEYIPPKGFLSQAIDLELSSVKAFEGIGPQGKQIWHIETPASVNISSIHRLALEEIKNGKPVLSHDGDQYALVQDFSGNRESINAIIPTSEGDYRAASQPIIQTLRLQLVVPDRATSALSQVAIKKPVRQQPDNLKQRFLPLGAKRKEVKPPKLEKLKKLKMSV